MPPDFNDVMGAWGILLAHHKHFNRLEYDTWVFEDSVSILRREIDLGNMEDSMNRVVSKLKFQEEILKDTKKPSREEKGEYDLQEHEDFVENQGKPELENEFEMEDLNQSFIDPLLLNQPIFPGAKIADRLLFSQAEKFIATIKLDQKAARSLKMLEFVKDGSDFDSINERLKPSTHVQDFYNSYIKLGNDQRTTFDIIAAHLLEQQCVKTTDNPTGQLRMIVSGEGGSGKSHLIDLIVLFSRIHYGFDHTPRGPVLVVAPTGMAANNVNGSTIHSACYTYKFNAENADKPSFLKLIQDNLGLIKVLLIEEKSMLGCDTLGKLDIIFRKATGRYDQFIGGLHYILLGDFYQLPPVMAKALYVDDTWYNDINAAGKEAYLACTCYKELLRNFRKEKVLKVSLWSV